MKTLYENRESVIATLQLLSILAVAPFIIVVSLVSI